MLSARPCAQVPRVCVCTALIQETKATHVDVYTEDTEKKFRTVQQSWRRCTDQQALMTSYRVAQQAVEIVRSFQTAQMARTRGYKTAAQKDFSTSSVLLQPQIKEEFPNSFAKRCTEQGRAPQSRHPLAAWGAAVPCTWGHSSGLHCQCPHQSHTALLALGGTLLLRSTGLACL